MKKHGVDVSFAQGKVDWKKVKESKKVDFAIIRAGFGREVSQEDSQFKNNYAGCRENNIPCGVYWYSYADSPEDARREAKACLEVIKGKQFEYPIYFDLEESFQFKNGKAFCDSLVRAFCNELEANGYFAGLYCSTSYLNNYISTDVAERYALWVAQYYSECTYKNADYGMWQYCSDGGVDGISGNVDRDECYIDYPTLIKNKGLNGFKKAAEKPLLDKDGFKKGDSTLGMLAVKELMLIAQKMGINKYGMYEDRTFGDGTLDAVNYLLDKWGYKPNGIAGEKFIKHLKADIVKAINALKK